ncbi:acyltransferase family protein [Pseudomonas xionganensis]|uniref:Acyltransferase family protein n=1 Tax=Pseudomonas xionganensis TaxID=2654845 RepID=A0A6I4KUM3_9PSED|nr:acyltransferase family protein [Pseudomonas xionganensis]MVW76075.1 acyltransferase family protein [Pseudomonas xionganensis]
MKFRSDINGLRAVAVLVVVFFHFAVPGFTGGFVGVDVFFVISGYLMAQIICSRCEQGSFSFYDFYMARVRRIFPALIAMLAVVLVFAGFVLLPTEYKTLGQHALASIGVVSNIVYWRESGYFDEGALDKWLLHTWSLSVEWQFYLVIPLVLVLALRWCQGHYLKPLLWFGFLSSLALCGLAPVRYETAAFYLLPARAWEFLLGALLYVYALRLQWLQRPSFLYLGLVLILLSSGLYSEALVYPSFWPLLPTLGAALVIGSAASSLVLDNRVMQFLGKTSYSLYLWHWPVLIAAAHFGFELGGLAPLWLFVISLFLAWLSFYFVEEWVRNGGRRTPGGRVRFGRDGGVLVCAGMIGLAGALVYLSEGLPMRLPTQIVVIAEEAESKNPRREECFRPGKRLEYPECRLGVSTQEPALVFWGDSHSDATFTGFAEAVEQAGQSAIYYGRSGCGPTLSMSLVELDDERDLAECLEYNQGAFDRIAGNVAITDVYLVARWSAEKYAQGHADFSGLMCRLSEAGKRVHVMAPVPVYAVEVPDYLARGLMRGQSLSELLEPLVQSPAEYRQKQAFAFAQFGDAERCAVQVLDPLPHLCPQGRCLPVRDGLPIYFDGGHLSERGSKLLTPMFLQSITAAGDAP